MNTSSSILLMLVALVAGATATTYEDCGSTATISSFSVSGCDAPPCTFTRGSQVTVQIDMVSVGNTESIHSELFAVIDGEEVELLHMDSCGSLIVGDCPLTFGELITYRQTFTVDPTWTPMSTNVIYTIHSDEEAKEGLEFVCIKLAINLV